MLPDLAGRPDMSPAAGAPVDLVDGHDSKGSRPISGFAQPGSTCAGFLKIDGDRPVLKHHGVGPYFRLLTCSELIAPRRGPGSMCRTRNEPRLSDIRRRRPGRRRGGAARCAAACCRSDAQSIDPCNLPPSTVPSTRWATRSPSSMTSSTRSAQRSADRSAGRPTLGRTRSDRDTPAVPHRLRSSTVAENSVR